MYAKFFGLNQDPFSIAPDPRYLFMSERHREALAHLLYGLKGGGGFVLLSGEIGTGKTTVCRCFLEQINGTCHVAYIFNPKLTSIELLRSICAEFHIEVPLTAVTEKDFIDPLNEFLLREHSAGQNVILIIDEAQNLSADVLEQLRLLTNLESSERKLLQIALIGQSELRSILAHPELAQLAQRVIARFHLEALSLQETKHYVAHRLAVAGLSGPMPFESKALLRVHKISHGIPRRINLLCGRAMLGAYANGAAHINKQMVTKAALEIFGTAIEGSRFKARFSLAGFRNRGGVAATIALAGLMGVLLGAALLTILSRPESALALNKTTVAQVMTVPVHTGSSTNATRVPQTLDGEMMLSRSELNSRLAANKWTQNQAWQDLGKAWGLSVDIHEPCRANLQNRVDCFNNKKTSLGLIRELNRPGIVAVVDDRKRITYAVLSAITLETAQLKLGNQTILVPLTLLAEVWQGNFSTLWRVPQMSTINPSTGKIQTNADWLATQMTMQRVSLLSQSQDVLTVQALASMSKKPLPASAMRAQIYAFQLAHGLTPDGQAGPMTLMQLNRAMGIDEPFLIINKP